MEPNFTTETAIEEKTYAQMILAKRRLFQKWLILFVYIIALPVVFDFTMRIENPFSAFGWVLRIFVLCLTAVIIPPFWRRVQRRSCKILGKKLYRGLKGNPPTISYRFFEDRVEVEDSGSGAQFTYPEIFQAAETPDYFMLFLSKSLCHAVAKERLSGDSASFGDFLTAHCDKPCVRIDY